MIKFYGVHNDKDLLVKTMCRNHIQPFSTECFPSDYTKVPVIGNDALFGVVANVEFLPNLAVWSDDQLQRNGELSVNEFFAGVVPYLANMTDEERQMIEPQINYLAYFSKVHSVKQYNATVEISVTLGGRSRILLITVMNMMEPHALMNCKVRITLN